MANSKNTNQTTSKSTSGSTTSSNTTSGSTTQGGSSSQGGSKTTSTSTTASVGKVDAQTQANYDSYKNGYQQSESVANAYKQLQESLANKPGEFSSQYQTQLSDLYDKISNREKFSYDFNKDAMYQMYKDRYLTQGKTAMKDTMGQAAALTGGYNSSYSQTAGQQTYQNYLQSLNDVIPTLRNQAKEEYDEEGNRLANQFSMANTLYGNDYNQYRAAVSDYQADRAYNQGAYESERNFDYSQFSSDRAYTAQEYWNMLNSIKQTTGESDSTNWSNSSNWSNTNGWSNTNSTTEGWSDTSSTSNSESSSASSGSSSGSSSKSSSKSSGVSKEDKKKYKNTSTVYSGGGGTVLAALY